MSKPELIVIDALGEIQPLLDLHRYLAEQEIIAYDCEATGLTIRDSVIGFSVCAEEDLAYYVILAKWDVENQELKIITEPKTRLLVTNILNLLACRKLIMHNAVYDCMMAEYVLKVRLIDALHTDTLVLAHLLDENRSNKLKDLATDFFGEDAKQEQAEMKASVTANGGKLTKDCYELYKADPYLLGKYGAKDALLTFKLFMELVPTLYAQNLDQFFYEDESMPLLRGATYDLNTTGLQVDAAKLSALKCTLKAESAEDKAFVSAEIQPYIKTKYPGTKAKDTFNIGSCQQLSWLLFDAFKLEFGTLTKEGKNVCKSLGLKLPYTAPAKREFIAVCENSVGQVYQAEAIINGKKKRAKKIKEPWAYIMADKKILSKHAPKYKWIERLLSYQKKMKLLNTYVEGIEEQMQYGVIHPSFLQAGTKTGRYASKDPNFQNLPRDDQRIKECIQARPGKVFVSADFSQLEPRTFAFYSKDSRLMSAFDGTSDFYSVVGIEVYDKFDATPQKSGSPEAFGVKYKKLRDHSKVIALASAYGATPNQLAPTTGKSIDETEQDMDKYFERFPGVQSMMLEAHDLVKKQGYVTNLFGRVRRIPEATRLTKLYGKTKHRDLPYEARKLLNMACNFRIQSTGASIVNRAAIQLYKSTEQAEIDCKLVLQVHDELIVECDEQDAENISLLLQDAMENTTILEGVPLEAIPRISKTLAK